MVMKVFKKFFVLLLFVGLTVNFVSAKDAFDFKVATVDVPSIVTQSSAVQDLKSNRQKQIEDLQKFVENARADVAKEKNEAKKKSLEEGYNKELNSRKSSIDNEYGQKLAEVDKKLTAQIEKEAKRMGYSLVLTKTTVLYGATDITKDILKVIK